MWSDGDSPIVSGDGATLVSLEDMTDTDGAV